MPHILLSEEDATEVAKTAKSSEKQSAISRAIISFFLIIVVLGLVVGIVIIARNIAKKTQGLNQNYTNSSENKGGGLFVSRSVPGLALPGISGGGSASSSRTPQIQAQASVSPKDMVLVPAGDYITGWNESGTPVKVNVPAFFMDVYEVTNQQYADFVRATGHKPPADPRGLKYNIWKNGTYPIELADHPVVYVDLDDARAYARWAGKRLPAEPEWHLAAQGGDERVWPWGSVFDPARCNTTGDRTLPVRSCPEGRSPYGCYHMAGNVWEWTESCRDDGHTRFVIIRGGSYFDARGSIWYVRGGPRPCTHHAKFILMYPGLDRCATIGFRCVVDIAP